MVHTFTFFVFSLLITSSVVGQSGYSFIRKAKKLIDQERAPKRALRLLDYAEDSDYGFCGNSYADAYWQINYLRGRLYYQQGDHDLALATLDRVLGNKEGMGLFLKKQLVLIEDDYDFVLIDLRIPDVIHLLLIRFSDKNLVFKGKF